MLAKCIFNFTILFFVYLIFKTIHILYQFTYNFFKYRNIFFLSILFINIIYSNNNLLFKTGTCSTIVNGDYQRNYITSSDDKTPKIEIYIFHEHSKLSTESNKINGKFNREYCWLLLLLNFLLIFKSKTKPIFSLFYSLLLLLILYKTPMKTNSINDCFPFLP